MNDYQLTRVDRDKRLRRKILTALKLAWQIAPRKGVGGKTLVENVDRSVARDDRFESDDHALGLIRDLVAKGYVVEIDERTHKRQMFSLDYLFFTITAKGIDLWNEVAPVDALVEDARIEHLR